MFMLLVLCAIGSALLMLEPVVLSVLSKVVSWMNVSLGLTRMVSSSETMAGLPEFIEAISRDISDMVTLFTDTMQLSLSPIIGVLHALGVCERENNDWLDTAIPMLVDGCGGVDVSVPSVVVFSPFSSSPIIENKLNDVGD